MLGSHIVQLLVDLVSCLSDSHFTVVRHLGRRAGRVPLMNLVHRIACDGISLFIAIRILKFEGSANKWDWAMEIIHLEQR